MDPQFSGAIPKKRVRLFLLILTFLVHFWPYLPKITIFVLKIAIVRLFTGKIFEFWKGIQYWKSVSHKGTPVLDKWC